jgi:hypothetical protein
VALLGQKVAYTLFQQENRQAAEMELRMWLAIFYVLYGALKKYELHPQPFYPLEWLKHKSTRSMAYRRIRKLYQLEQDDENKLYIIRFEKKRVKKKEIIDGKGPL